MQSPGDETTPGPLDPYFAEYLRALDDNATPDRLHQLQAAQRERLARASAGDPDRAAALDRELQQFYSAQPALGRYTASLRSTTPPDVPSRTHPLRADPGGPGVRIGNYDIVRMVDIGGMGIVYEAIDRRLNRTVAVKCLLARMSSPDLRQRFERESRAMAALRHENIIQIHEIDEHDGEPYFVMEFAEGGSLAGYLRSLGLPNWGETPPPPADAARMKGCRDLLLEPKQLRESVELLALLGRAMAYAHGKGVLHRDLKPGNILLQGDRGQAAHLRAPRIADFGLAKLQQDGQSGYVTTGFVGGTPFYAAPEQFKDRVPIDVRADVYSLGAILHELLVGEPPFREAYGADPSLFKVLEVKETGRLQLHRVDPRVPADLRAICEKCLHVESAHRFEKVLHLTEELERWLRGEPIHIRPVPWWQRLAAYVRRERLKAALWGVSALAAVIVLISVGRELWQAGERRDRQADTARRAEVAIDRALVLQGRAQAVPGDLSTVELAVAAAREAESIARAGEASDALRQRVTTLITELQREADDARLLASIDQARLRKVRLLFLIPPRDRPAPGWLYNGDFLNADAEKLFVAAFKDYGLDLDRLSDADVIRTLQARPARVRDEASMALTELALLRGGLSAIKRFLGKPPLDDPEARSWVRFFQIAQEIDKDPWRTAFRKTLLRSNPLVTGMELSKHSHAAMTLPLPSSSVCVLAEIWGAVRQPYEGIALLRPVERRRPNDALVCCYLAFLEMQMARPSWPDIANWYRAALALAPDSAVINHNLGIAYCHLQRTDVARAYFQEATRLDPHFAAAWHNYGVTLYDSGKVSRAMDCYRQALQQDAGFFESRENLVALLRQRGDVGESRAVCEEGLRLHPQKALLQYNYAFTLWDADDTSEAVQAFQRAIHLNRNYAEAEADLGRLLLAVGKSAEALPHLERARRLMATRRDPRLEKVVGIIAECKRQAELDRLLPAIIHGTTELTDREDRLVAARLAALRAEYATAARLYAAAFEIAAPPFDGIQLRAAAAAAARAGCAAPRGPAAADATERTRLREQALAWLRDDLEEVRRLQDSADEPDQFKALVRLKAWLRDARLACVRDADALAALPPAERARWGEFWNEVTERAARPPT